MLQRLLVDGLVNHKCLAAARRPQDSEAKRVFSAQASTRLLLGRKHYGETFASICESGLAYCE